MNGSVLLLILMQKYLKHLEVNRSEWMSSL